MSHLKKRTGYSISGLAAGSAALLATDRFAEFASGAEGLLSYGLPPVVMMALSVTAFVIVKAGHPAESNRHA